MVAAAGDSSVLSPRLAATGVAALMAALAVAIALNGHVVYPRFVPLPFSPEVLRTKADDLQMRLGYGGGADAVDGFRMRSDFLDWARANLVDEDPRGELTSLAPPMLTFWRHTSPSVIVGDSLGTVGDGPARFSGSAATPRDVPASVAPVAGATLIELAPDGRLVRFEASPPAFRTGAGRSEEPDWRGLFAAAALDYSTFRPVESTLVSGVHADERRAWQRQPATNARVGPLRVEAGTFEGRIAYFELVAPWTTSHRKRVEWAVPPAMRRGLVTLFIVIAIAGLTLARRNVRLGRSDRRGAARLAGFVGLMTFVATVLATHHVAGSVELGIITGTSAFSLYIAAMTWVFYVALEPFVRRRWPQALVGWTRLLAGGWRDPLVGRELLVGSVAGVVTHALSLAGSVLIERLAGDWVAPWDVANSVKWLALSTPSPALYAAAATLAAAPFFALIGLFILFMMRVALRHEALAALAYVAVLLLLFAGAMTHPAIQLPLSFVLIGIGVLVLTRFGFLAYTAVSFPAVVIAILGVSFDFNVFYGTTMIAGMMLSVAPGLFGAYTALGGRPMFGALLKD
jgi:serine/threonine-protein kinase